MANSQTFALNALAATHTVTMDAPERESGMAIVRRPVQLLRVESNEDRLGAVLALYTDGSVYEMADGSTAWNEVTMPE